MIKKQSLYIETEDHINDILNKYLNESTEEKSYDAYPRGQNLSNINKGYNKLRKHSEINFEFEESNDIKIDDEIKEAKSKPKIPRRTSTKKTSIEEINSKTNTNAKKQSKRRASIVKELCSNTKNNELGNLLEGELIAQINSMKEEINLLKVDKENLIKANNINKDLLGEKIKEIEILNEKLKLMKEVVKKTENDIYETKKSYSSNYNSQVNTEKKSNNLQDINNQLKQENLDLCMEIDILKVKTEEMHKMNNDLKNINENLNSQINSYKQKYTLEITELLNKLNELEKDKLSMDLKIKELEKIDKNNLPNNFNNFLAKESSNSLNLNFSCNSNKDLNTSLNNSTIEKDYAQGGSKGKSILASLKNEIKTLQKKNENEKILFDNTINLINEELKAKEDKIQELTQIMKKYEIENSALIDKFAMIEKDYLSSISNVKEFKSIGENAVLTAEKLKESNNVKNDIENKLYNLTMEINNLKFENESLTQNIDRNKKMEIALKNELNIKEEEMTKRTEIIKQLQIELANLNDDNLLNKKENMTLKTKLDLSETEIITKYEHEINAKNHEIFILNEKNSNFEKSLENLKEKFSKKENIIKLKKLANITLIEIIKSKRNEVKCLEAMQYMNSVGMKENIKTLRDNENILLMQYGFL